MKEAQLLEALGAPGHVRPFVCLGDAPFPGFVTQEMRHHSHFYSRSYDRLFSSCCVFVSHWDFVLGCVFVSCCVLVIFCVCVMLCVCHVVCLCPAAGLCRVV